MEQTTEIKQIFYDPFAEGAPEFNPLDLFAQLEETYLVSGVEHDGKLDEFVRKTEALMLDAKFVDNFDAVRAIAMRMHELCGEDHSGLRNLVENSSFFSNIEHSKNDGHNHTKNEDDEYEIGPDGKKRKKKNHIKILNLLSI